MFSWRITIIECTGERMGREIALRPISPATAFVIAVSTALLAVVSCSPQQSSDQKQAEAVSQTPPKLKELSKPPPAVAARPRVASEGDCAPRYANGGRGTCINN